MPSNEHKIVNPDENFNYKIGSDSWLLREIKGSRITDKFLFNSLKLIYILSRVTSRVLLGRKKRDRLWIRKNISFRNFLYQSVEFLKLDEILLLEFYIPKYDFKFYSRITQKVNNFLIDDMYKSMYSHEDDMVELFTPKEGDVVVDVGAAFGFYSIIASKRMNGNGKIIAIEPQTDSFKMLNLSIRLNKLKNITTLNYAVYSKSTELSLYSTYSVLSERSEKHLIDYIKVNAERLDQLVYKIDNISKIDWIKIDVEGAELEVLKGAHNTLLTNDDIHLLIEIHGEDKFPLIIDFLNDYGFKIKFIKEYEWGDKHVILHKHTKQ